jgi:two-component system cell cycle sensor histidine kinase/response regulator CckA
MDKRLRILILEDVPADAELMSHQLRKGGVSFSALRVDTKEGFLNGLKDFLPDLILADYSLPCFDGLSALAVVRERCPDIPVIFVSGALGEELAIEALRKGATDYVPQDRLSRLVPAVNRALRESEEQRERKRIEEALRSSQARFLELFNDAPVGYHELDKEGRLIEVNKTELEMLGYTAEEVLGQPVWTLMVEEEVSRKALMEKMSGLQPPGRQFERIYRKKDGTILPVLIEDRLVRDSEGKIRGIRSTIVDITERKKAEEEVREGRLMFQDLFDRAPVGYFETDPKGLITRVNRTELELLGYGAAEMLGRPIWDFITEKENVRQHFFGKLFGKILPEGSYDCCYLKKDGTSLSVSANDRLLRDEKGKMTGMRVTIHDITERKQAEQEMAGLQEQLRQSQKMEAIGRLAGGIAHDFNNLLTIIKGYSQLLLMEKETDGASRESLNEIQAAADGAANLTRQLLAFSRRQVLDLRVFDLNTVLRELNKMLCRLIGEDIELVMRLSEDPGKVKTDSGWMEQVIMNLTVNARDAMPSGGKLIIETANVELDDEYVRCHVSVAPGPYVMLSVSDTGVGMTREVREQIFEPFFTTKEKGKGTGLGLSTVYGIVKQSGGNVWVSSEPGEGTVFKIYLPRINEPVEIVAKKKELKEVPGGNETVLVVEDAESVRKLVVRVLRKQGYHVLEATQGQEALLACERYRGPIHLVVTDVVMPGMGGPELVGRLRQVRQELKVIYISGYTDEPVVRHGVLEGEVDFIQKPFTVESLAHKAREVLDKD